MRYLFLSSHKGWGGSEGLWGATAVELAGQGHEVLGAMEALPPEGHPERVLLEQAGVRLVDLSTVAWRLFGSAKFSKSAALRWLRSTLRTWQPQLTIISLSANFARPEWMELCLKLGSAYGILVHQVDDARWPNDLEREKWRALYLGSKRSWFVSRSNAELVCRQLTLELPQAGVVCNPFQTSSLAEPVPWPAQDASTAEMWRLACVARLDIRDKGQDILLQVIALEKWRSRPVRWSFCGKGAYSQTLAALAKHLQIEDRIEWLGHVNGIATLWETHHALVLPSRKEGLPIALVEAMWCGRPAIATAVGGTAELVIEGQTGFLAPYPDVNALDEALERAWQQRHQWQALGLAACQLVRARMPADAGRVFAATISAASAYPTP